MIESILEWQPIAIDSTNINTGNMNVAQGGTAVTGSGLDIFNSEDIMIYEDDAGVLRTEEVTGPISAGALNFVNPAQSLATNKPFKRLDKADITGAYFRADNSQLKNAIIVPTNSTQRGTLLKSPLVGSLNDYLSVFDKDEGFEVKSLYIRLPYQFTMADAPLAVSLSYTNLLNQLVENVQSVGEPIDFGSAGFFIPVENIEVPIGAYVKPPANTIGDNYQISAQLRNARTTSAATLTADAPAVSNINAPDELNGRILPVTLGMRIVHASTPLVVN